jgi:hypothetical protein
MIGDYVKSLVAYWVTTDRHAASERMIGNSSPTIRRYGLANKTLSLVICDRILNDRKPHADHH